MSQNLSQNLLLHPHFAYRFNAAAWLEQEKGNTFLIAREVRIAASEGEPDKGDMVLLELDDNGQVIRERVVWQLDGASQLLLEDPRALVCTSNQVLLGLTAVVEEDNIKLPYPAVAILDNSKFEEGFLPEVKVIDKFGPGKNTTPLDENGNFLFRPESLDSSHNLLVFNLNGEETIETGKIDFPKDIPWALWRIGSTMPPIWINEKEALMIFHGITIEDGKFIYSLGKAKLHLSDDDEQDRKYQVEVDYQSLITPDYFIDQNGKALVDELHPELRRVVYACGGVQKKVNGQLILALYVNVGDRQTIEVQIPWKKLIDGWWIN